MSGQQCPVPPPMPENGVLNFPTQCASLSPSPTWNASKPTERNVSPNLLSSQKFKDELAAGQARLSPNPDSQLSIDEKIRLRKAENRDHSHQTVDQADSAQLRLPEKLISTSTLQRDKRPFAYSPDVNDPNNRGKLDLSQIKSPIMRRRLIANLEESQEADEEELEADDHGCKKEYATDSRPSTSSSGVHHEHVAIKLLKDDAHQPQQVCYYSRPKGAVVTTKQETKPEANPPIVHYSAPPKFYQLLDSNKHASNCTDYLNSLDAEIAESLESLNLLADNLKAKHHHHHQQQQQQQNQQQDCSRQSLQDSELGMATTMNNANHNNRMYPHNVSTFLPTASDQQQISYRRQPQPNFYSVLPSGRQAGEYCHIDSGPSLSSSSNYFGPNSTGGPYEMSPYYGQSLHMDETRETTTKQTAWSSRMNNKPTTSHGTFSANKLTSTPPKASVRYDDITDSPSTSDSYGSQNTRYYQETSLPHSIQQHWPVDQQTNDDRVRALREMTDKLKKEVSRLYNYDIALSK